MKRNHHEENTQDHGAANKRTRQKQDRKNKFSMVKKDALIVKQQHELEGFKHRSKLKNKSTTSKDTPVIDYTALRIKIDKFQEIFSKWDTRSIYLNQCMERTEEKIDSMLAKANTTRKDSVVNCTKFNTKLRYIQKRIKKIVALLTTILDMKRIRKIIYSMLVKTNTSSKDNAIVCEEFNTKISNIQELMNKYVAQRTILKQGLKKMDEKIDSMLVKTNSTREVTAVDFVELNIKMGAIQGQMDKIIAQTPVLRQGVEQVKETMDKNKATMTKCLDKRTKLMGKNKTRVKEVATLQKK